MQQTEISVIIPTRNRAAWLPTCLAHLEQQTFPAGQFEVIVVDDGSADDTSSVLQRYASGSPVCIRPLSLSQPHPGLACNIAAEAAHGKRLLFLADDELASPRLLEQHHRLHEVHGEGICTLGDVRRHPQLPRDTFTRLLLPDEAPVEAEGDSTHFLAWKHSNYCMSRTAFQEAGAFHTDAACAPVLVPDLAHRLMRAGVSPVWTEDARAYVWQPASFDGERQRQYHYGVGLRYLQTRTGATEIPRRYRLRQRTLDRLMGAITLPFYVRACTRHEEESGVLIGQLYKTVLQHDRLTGYLDASQGRPARRLG